MLRINKEVKYTERSDFFHDSIAVSDKKILFSASEKANNFIAFELDVQ